MKNLLTTLAIILAFTLGFAGGVSWSSLPPIFDASSKGSQNPGRHQAVETTHEKTPPLVGSAENGGFIVYEECSRFRTSGIDLYYDPANDSTICVAAPGGTAYAGQPYKPHVNSVPDNCAVIPEESVVPPDQRPESGIAFDQRVYCASVPQLNNDALQGLYERGQLPLLSR